MDLPTIPEISEAIKGAIVGGAIGAIIDRGPFLKRTMNGFGAILAAIAFAPATIDLGMYFAPVLFGSARVHFAVAATWALVGLIVAESIQRIARAALRDSDAIGAKIANKIGERLDD
jgi:hypothetical protein